MTVVYRACSKFFLSVKLVGFVFNFTDRILQLIYPYLGRSILPYRWRQSVPPTGWYPLTRPHDITSKTQWYVSSPQWKLLISQIISSC